METKSKRKTKQGIVISDRMEKTVVVAIERQFAHPTYKKIIRKTSKFKAHDEENRCKIGDEVIIQETRPLSKEKCWRVIEIVKKTN